MKEIKEGRPPILGTWRNLYLLLVSVLLILITFFYLFTKHFA